MSLKEEINKAIDEYRASLDADIIIKIIEKRIDERIAWLKKKKEAQERLGGNFNNTIRRLDEMRLLKELLR